MMTAALDREIESEISVGYFYRANALLNDISPAVITFLKSKGASHEDAEDALQNAVISIWRKNNYDSKKGRFVSWLRLQSFHRLVDSYRKSSRRAAINLESETLNDWCVSKPEPLGKHLDLRETTQRALAEIPSHERDILELTYARERSYTQVANCFQIPLGTVKSRLHRARETMMKKTRLSEMV